MLEETAVVAMAVHNLAAYRALYSNELGLSELGYHEEGEGGGTCVYGIGPSMLILREDQAAPVASTNAAPPTKVATPTRAAVSHFALLVDDMDRTYASLKDRQLAFVAGPEVTPLGHRNMQRSLLQFPDPDGLAVQLSQTVDTRPHLEGRRTAKQHMAKVGDAPKPFGGFDHISTYCTDFPAARDFYRKQLGLEEFFHSTTRESGQAVAPGFAQSAFAIGGTDIELATCPPGNTVAPLAIRQIGFWTNDLDRTYHLLRQRGAPSDGPPSNWTPLPGIAHRAFSLAGPDGLNILIAQRA
jgi:catechol 2,3-dioxygenase-like lactoylglutathione lyase family enzyme